MSKDITEKRKKRSREESEEGGDKDVENKNNVDDSGDTDKPREKKRKMDEKNDKDDDTQNEKDGKDKEGGRDDDTKDANDKGKNKDKESVENEDTYTDAFGRAVPRGRGRYESTRRMDPQEGAMLSYKEFLIQEEDDDQITPEMAVKKYNEYKENYKKKWERRFFNEHSLDPWFQGLYLPSHLAQILPERDARIKKYYEEFMAAYKEKGAFPNAEIDLVKDDDDDDDENGADGAAEGGPKSKKDEEGKINSKNESKSSSSKAKYYRNCVLVKFIPTDTTRTALLDAIKEKDGLEGDFMFRPDTRSRDLTRSAWLQFSDEAKCESVVKQHSTITINDRRLSLLPAEKARDAIVPKFTLDDERVAADLDMATKLANKLDERHGIKNEFLSRMDDAVFRGFSTLKKLNIVVEYLRRVHLHSYYVHQSFQTYEELLFTVGEKFTRSGTENDAESWYAKLREETQRLIDGDVASYAAAACGGTGDDNEDDKASSSPDYEAPVQEFLEAKTIKLSEPGKFRCALCTKLFKADYFVHKHLRNKHKEEVLKAKVKAQDEQFFANYQSDPHRIVHLPPPPSTGPPGPHHNGVETEESTGKAAVITIEVVIEENIIAAPLTEGRTRDRSPRRYSRGGGDYRGGGDRSPSRRDTSVIVNYEDIDAVQEEELVVDYEGMNLEDLED
eukprot:jgi/Bigna1/141334/aug1.62_g16042